MIDLNGTLDSNPNQFAPMLRALRAAGHVVSIVTGVSKNDPDPKKAFADKVQQLVDLACSDVYDDMTVISVPEGPKLAAAKATWCSAHAVSCAVDNDKTNAKALMDVVPLVLVPWATRVN